MKKLLLNSLFITLLSLLIACSKDPLTQADSTTLEGKWKPSEYYVSNGSTGEWVSAPKNEQRYILFKRNGQLESTVFNDYIGYLIKDSLTIVLIKKDNSIQNYLYKLEDGKLSMSPNGPVWCIEGCEKRFVKIEDLVSN